MRVGRWRASAALAVVVVVVVMEEGVVNGLVKGVGGMVKLLW